MMKSRIDIITSMCYTWRHDFGLNRESGGMGTGMTENERQRLWDRMAQVFDNDIAPLMCLPVSTPIQSSQVSRPNASNKLTSASEYLTNGIDIIVDNQQVLLERIEKLESMLK